MLTIQTLYVILHAKITIMETKVNLNIALVIKAYGKTQEEIEGFAYWLFQPFIEQFVGSADLIGNEEYEIKDFEIEVDNKNNPL